MAIETFLKYKLVLAVLGQLSLEVPVTTGTDFVTELQCLADNIYYESKYESDRGKRGVAHVTLNRVASPHFSNSICGVVYEPSQFSWTLNPTRFENNPTEFKRELEDGIEINTRNLHRYERSVIVAARAIYGLSKDPTCGAKFFYNPDFASPEWAYDDRYYPAPCAGPDGYIDNHRFFKRRGDNKRYEVARYFGIEPSG